jgi:hypothetical protein
LLGLNLAGVNIRADEDPNNFHDHVVPDHNFWNNNAVDEVCRSADAQGLHVLVRDGQLSGRYMGERIMLHPESFDDFETHGGFTADTDDFFNSFILDPSPFTRTLREREGELNCIYMSENSGEVSGVTLERIQEMSAFRDADPNDPQRISGLYHVSVILRQNDLRGFPLPNTDETPVLTVTIRYTDPTSGAPVAIPCILEARQLWQGDPALGIRLTGVQEIVIGEIEIQQTVGRLGGDVIFVEEQTDAEHQARWNLLGVDAVRGPLRLRDHGLNLANVLGDFDIRISYGDDDVHLWLDAVCLTNPATFGLWNPGNPRTLPAHSGHRAAMEERMDFLLRNDDPALMNVGAIPGLRFVMGEEQVFNNGTYWSTFLLSRMIEDQTDGHVQLFSTYGAETNTAFTPILAAEMITGPYNYPILTEHPRPTMQAITAQNYLTPLYDPEERPNGFRGMWRLLLANIQTRSQFAPDRPWIPYIQNHTNLLVTNPPQGWYDGIPNREPSASELRFQCNTALAFGATGVLFYAFSSVPYAPAPPTTPPTVFATHRILPNPAEGVDWFDPIDMNVGTLGFLGSEGVEDVPRTLDWNGEDKWDSTQTYIEDFLEPVGSYISQHLRWVEGLQWYCRGAADAGSCDLVSMIVSRRQDIPNGVDPQAQTYVMVSEFGPNPTTPPLGSTPTSRFLFVLNGNTYDGPLHEGIDPVGQRHITVKLSTDEGRVDEWRVTNVFTNDVWIVRATNTPDETSYDNGFTEYFAPGAAALYRLDPMIEESTDFRFSDAGGCEIYGRDIYIEPAATLRLDGNDVVAFTQDHGLYCDGEMVATGTTFRGCGTEAIWNGLFARNGGSLDLTGAKVRNAGVIVGSSGLAELAVECSIEDTRNALTNIGGTILSNSTTSSGVERHLYSYGGEGTTLVRDESIGGNYVLSTAIDIGFSIYSTRIDECVFSSFWRGTRVEDTDLIGDADNIAPIDGGNNSLQATTFGLMALNDGVIDFGGFILNPAEEALNEIVLDVPGYHGFTDASSHIFARHCWWEPLDNGHIPPISISGDVEYYPMLQQDPILFAPGNGESLVSSGTLQKTGTSAPPGGLREQVRVAIAARNHGAVRHLIGQFLASPEASNAEIPLLRYLHRALRTANGRGGIDSLLNLTLGRSDITSKLLASDILAEDSLFTEAIHILNAYSFAGSATLQKRALVRKSVLYPRAWRGGYVDGLFALDSLRALNDSTLLPFLDVYVPLYSRLSSASTPFPKSRVERALDRSLPSDIDVWPNYPNPFSDVTSFTFKLGEDKHVRLAIYDAMGREVKVITDADYQRGVHSAVLRSGDLPNGLYFYRLTTDEGVIQRKMLLMR